jgi:hypothetical protein
VEGKGVEEGWGKLPEIAIAPDIEQVPREKKPFILP